MFSCVLDNEYICLWCFFFFFFALFFVFFCFFIFFFQAEDGIRDLVRSRGLGDVYKRQARLLLSFPIPVRPWFCVIGGTLIPLSVWVTAWGSPAYVCLLYTSDAADERARVDLGGGRSIKKKTTKKQRDVTDAITTGDTVSTLRRAAQRRNRLQ